MDQNTTPPASPHRHVCCIIPPHLLEFMSATEDCDGETRESARQTLDQTHSAIGRARPQGSRQAPQGIVPDSLLSDMSRSEHVDDETRESARTTLGHSKDIRDQRQTRLAGDTSVPDDVVERDIYDAQHSQSMRDLPGKLIRQEGQPATTSQDVDVNACYDNFGYTNDFYFKVFGRDSVDDKNLPLIGTVHFGTRFANAFWDGQQMVFGDGNKFLYHFTQALDVIAHELTHGVTQNTTGLIYQGQSGALNESISDCFGVMAKQYHEGVTTEQADWLIGEDCIFPGVKGVALRSMKAPGTAYNDPKIGRDQQGATMDEYQNLPNTQAGDNGGVHINSGIPNRAFYLTAAGFGGYSWEKAGQIWYKTITTPNLVPADCDFRGFAKATSSVALDMYGEDAQSIVEQAWTTVGVL